jgi:hypothetical protein
MKCHLDTFTKTFLYFLHQCFKLVKVKKNIFIFLKNIFKYSMSNRNNV